MNKAGLIIRELILLGSPERAKASTWFFKTGEGQYGYGDKFLGLTVPQQRGIAKKYRDLELGEIEKLLKNEYHEARLTGLLIVVERFKKAEQKERERIFKFYCKNTGYINNWDLVDLSAPSVVSGYLADKDRSILYRWARSKNIWERRIAIIGTFGFIRVGDFDDALTIAEYLLSDTHDLIHKAVGWMLREVGKKSPDVLREFLAHTMKQMPRTMLRYAIERFPEKERRRFLEESRS